MTHPPGSPPRPPAPAVTARPGVLTRWKLTEPVRLYLYALAAVALAGLTLAGYLTGEWSDYWVHALGVLLGVVPAAEAVRSSVYSPAGTVAAIRRAVALQDAGQAGPALEVRALYGDPR